MPITHAFVSAVPDDGDPNEVGPDEWNDDHVIALTSADITGLDAALAAKAPLASPTFTGAPAAPTAAVDTNTTQIATTAFVVAQIADDAQPKDSDLTAVAGLSTTGLVERTGAGTAATRTIGVAGSTEVPDRAAADTRYAQIDLAEPGLIVPPFFRLQDATSTTGSSYGSTTAYANYIGRAQKAYTAFKIRLNFAVAITGITWAEFGIASSTAPSPATAKNLTRLGYADISGLSGTTGPVSIDITATCAIGDHLWLVFTKLSTGTPAFRSNPIGDANDFGLILNGGNIRFSTMSNPTSFSAGVTTVQPIHFLCYPT